MEFYEMPEKMELVEKFVSFEEINQHLLESGFSDHEAEDGANAIQHGRAQFVVDAVATVITAKKDEILE